MKLRKRFALSLAPALLAAALMVPAMPVHAASDSGEIDVDIKVTIPSPGAFEVTDAQFRWGVNDESTSPAHEPGRCNFLSAGAAGDAGSSRVWSEADGFFSVKEGNTRIERPSEDGKSWVAETWQTRCTAPASRPDGTGTGGQVVIDQGSGNINVAKGTAQIKWSGSFSIVFYDGRTYWSLSDPVLDVANGKGKVTATASGYAADREDTTIWRELPDTTITMADLPKVELGQNGIVTTPAYRGVKLGAGAGKDLGQNTESDWWGSFPESWVKFNQSTGQGAFWYSSGGMYDRRKVATDMYISYTPTSPVIDAPVQVETPDAGAGDTSAEEPNGGATTDSKNSGTANNAGTGQTSAGTTTVQNLVNNMLSSALPPVAALAGAGTSVLEPAAFATSTISWLGKSLIPEAIERVMDYKEPLLWSLAGLLALGSVAWVGFRHGWLLWPFSSKSRGQK